MPQDLAPLAFPSASLPTGFDQPMHAHAPSGRRIQALSGRQKAAIVVRLLLAEGADLNIASLPEDSAALRRMMLENRDGVARALRARAADI